MKITKDDILLTAVRLFAQRGYDAVSTGMIAGELGVTKGALYRHFENKQAIYDGIIQKMFELDAAGAEEDRVPVQNYADDPESFSRTVLSDFCDYANHQFVFWTEDPFAVSFRRMITLEQFKSSESMKLYQDVIALGPVRYTADQLRIMIENGQLNARAAQMGADVLALQLFAPLRLMIQLCDGGEDPARLKRQLSELIRDWEIRWTT